MIIGKKNGIIKGLVSIICLTLFLFYTQLAYAQQDILKKEITTEFNYVRLNDAFRQIEKQLSIYFTFDGSLINTNKIITQSFKAVPLVTCLDRMLQDSLLVYKVIDNHIIIRRKDIERQDEILIIKKPKILTISGLIIDRISREALPFATISIKGQSHGVVSNNDGDFVLKVPDSLKNAQLCISHLGYANFCCQINELKDTSNVFRLDRAYIPIQEVIIRKKDEKNIIRNALKNIEKNYSNDPAYLTGFYRESVNLGKRYMFYSEAVLKIYKSGYTNLYDNDMIKVVKSRKMQDLSMEDTVIIKLKSGLESTLKLDIVKNPIEFLEEDNFDSYEYQMTDIVSINDKDAYLIEFKPQAYATEAIFEGKIYIDIRDLAIIGFEFQVNPKKITNSQGQYIVKKKRGINLKISNIAYKVSYRRIGNKYFLNYVNGDLNLRVRKAGKLFSFTSDVSFEMTVNEVDTNNVEKFKRKEAARLHTIFFDEIFAYDEEFWEHYNYIKPDESLQQTIEKNKNKAKNP